MEATTTTCQNCDQRITWTPVHEYAPERGSWTTQSGMQTCPNSPRGPMGAHKPVSS